MRGAAFFQTKMPIYTYQPENADDGTEPVERMYAYPPPEKLRIDGVWYARSAVEPIAVVGLKPQPAQGDEVLRGYYDQECALGSRFRTRLPTETIKRAWKDDQLSPLEKAADEGCAEASRKLLETVPA